MPSPRPTATKGKIEALDCRNEWIGVSFLFRHIHCATILACRRTAQATLASIPWCSRFCPRRYFGRWRCGPSYASACM